MKGKVRGVRNSWEQAAWQRIGITPTAWYFVRHLHAALEFSKALKQPMVLQTPLQASLIGCARSMCPQKMNSLK